MFYSIPNQKNKLSQSEIKKRSVALWVVLGSLATLSLLVGYQAFSNYVLSEQSLKKAKGEFEQAGKTSSPLTCVDKAVQWLPRCEGLFSLCERIVPELMTICLSQQDRAVDCQNMSVQFRSTKFGAKECAAMELSKRYKKSCGLAFREIDNYCYELSKSKPVSPARSP
jgi:hypothetical protein